MNPNMMQQFEGMNCNTFPGIYNYCVMRRVDRWSFYFTETSSTTHLKM